MKKCKIWEKPVHFKASPFFTKKIYAMMEDQGFLEAVSDCFSDFEDRYIVVGHITITSDTTGTRAVVHPAKKQEYGLTIPEEDRTITMCESCRYYVRNNEGHTSNCPHMTVLSVLKS